MFLWAWVRTQTTVVKNESQTSIYLPVNYENVEKGLTIVKSPDKVIINVKGPPRLIDEVTPDLFKATVDLSGKDVGQSWADISVRVPPGFTLTDIQPQRANVVMEYYQERTFNLKIKVKGQPKEGFKQGAAVFEPETVQISGAESTLKKIESVRLTIDASGKDRDLRVLVQPEPLDKNNQFVSVKVIPEFVEVDLPIRENIRTATLPVSPKILGNPAQGFKVDYVEVNPPVATVLFTGKEGDQVQQLSTEAIKINKKKSLIDKEVNIIQPPGAQLVDRKTIHVKIHFKEES